MPIKESSTAIRAKVLSQVEDFNGWVRTGNLSWGAIIEGQFVEKRYTVHRQYEDYTAEQVLEATVKAYQNALEKNAVQKAENDEKKQKKIKRDEAVREAKRQKEKEKELQE